ncbi:MAG: hypothetical protein JWN82_323 [Candidatus Saccharibacteria bacterium]|nr:hypothetical protein [Candidatus Saccharibacteria bacterium]
MDEALIRKLSRQVKVLNFFLVFFSVIFIAVLAVTGLVAYRALQEVRDAKNTLTSLQSQAGENLNVKNDLCDSSGTLGSLLKSQSDVCE